MNKENNPCYQCPDRWRDVESRTDCHQTCPRYAKQVRNNEHRKRREREYQWTANYIGSVQAVIQKEKFRKRRK